MLGRAFCRVTPTVPDSPHYETTSPSLLVRVRNPADEAAWQEFATRYAELRRDVGLSTPLVAGRTAPLDSYRRRRVCGVGCSFDVELGRTTHRVLGFRVWPRRPIVVQHRVSHDRIFRDFIAVAKPSGGCAPGVRGPALWVVGFHLRAAAEPRGGPV